MADVKDVLWQFVRGILPVGGFEHWSYQSQELEVCLGKDFYLDLISTRFDDPREVTDLKRSIYDWLRAQGYPVCECFLWGALKKMGFGLDWEPREVDARLELLRQRTTWLELRRCRRCGQAWYVACDTVDDDWYFRRMSEKEVAEVLSAGRWPKDFDGDSRYGLGCW